MIGFQTINLHSQHGLFMHKTIKNKYLALTINAVLGLSFGGMLNGCAGQGTLDERQVKIEALQPQTINITEIQLVFAKHWLREQRFGNNPSDIEQLTQDYGRILTNTIGEFFSAQGWTVITDKGTATINATASVKEMRIIAPDYRLVRSDLYVRGEIGSGEFELTLTRNGQGQHAQKMLYCKDDRIATFGSPNQLQKTNKGINQMAFKKELKQFLTQCVVGNQ